MSYFATIAGFNLRDARIDGLTLVERHRPRNIFATEVQRSPQLMASQSIFVMTT